MGSDCHQQPPHQASTPHRPQPQLPRPMPRRRQPFGLPPAPPMAQAHGHPNTPQAPDRVAAARAAARLMQVPRGRRNATALSVGLTHPPPGARCDAPGGRPQGLARVPLPLAPRVVTAARQGTDDVALTRRLPGRGRPLTGRGGCQRRGPARAPRGRGLCAAVDRGPEAGPRRRQQGLQHLPTRKTAVEPQALQAETPGDQPRQAGTPHTIPGRRGPHPPARQVSAAASAHGRGRGRGAQVCRATLGVATEPSS